MIATLFGDVDPHDPQAMRQWIYAHDQEHRLIRRTASLLGVSLNSTPLATSPDNDWMGRHGLAHLGFERLYVPNSTAPAITLATNLWGSEREFYNWHQNHNFIHQVLRQQLGIFGSN